MLACQRRDPQIVALNEPAAGAQLGIHRGIEVRGATINIEYSIAMLAQEIIVDVEILRAIVEMGIPVRACIQLANRNLWDGERGGSRRPSLCCCVMYSKALGNAGIKQIPPAQSDLNSTAATALP